MHRQHATRSRSASPEERTTGIPAAVEVRHATHSFVAGVVEQSASKGHRALRIQLLILQHQLDVERWRWWRNSTTVPVLANSFQGWARAAAPQLGERAGRGTDDLR